MKIKSNIRTFAVLSISVLLMASGGCRRSNAAKERVQAEREKWEASLPDSLKLVEHQTDSIRNEIEVLNHRFDAMIHTFNYVDNPREVEGYYIAGAWAQNYPLKSTGLVARLTKNEKLELIAALSGGAHFNRIRVIAGEDMAETSSVPHDQALNYRMQNINTVCFSDSASNSCARLIADNTGGEIKIIYLDDDKQTGTLSYPKESQQIMAQTWNLYETRSAITRDEHMLPMLAKKGAIISAKLEQIKKKK